MKHKFSCPQCAATFRVTEVYAGRQFPCPRCKFTLTVPSFNDLEAEEDADEVGAVPTSDAPSPQRQEVASTRNAAARATSNQDFELDAELLATQDSNVAATSPNAKTPQPSSIPQDSTVTVQPFDIPNTENDAAELDAEVVNDDFPRFEPPKPDPDDPMLKLFPDFVPNPFEGSFMLNQKFACDEEEEEDEGATRSKSKMPSVDELIS